MSILHLLKYSPVLHKIPFLANMMWLDDNYLESLPKVIVDEFAERCRNSDDLTTGPTTELDIMREILLDLPDNFTE
jgi:hypothetical protein